MSKTLLAFEGKLIDVYKIKFVEKAERWNDNDLRMDYNIEFNRPYNEGFGTDMPLTFSYKTEELRDNKMETLMMVLESHEFIKVIEGS